MIDPYSELPVAEWSTKTRALIALHPLKMDELRAVVLQVWDSIFKSGIGSKPFRIGVDLFPRPQVMAFFLHELIPLELAQRYPGAWRREENAGEKDAVYLPNSLYSFEIKTSSHPKQIFGNRSYAQPTQNTKKSKSGYYLTINFEPFSSKTTYDALDVTPLPRISRLRFGWLDLSDRVGQTAASGQQARLQPEADRYKLIEIPL